MYARELMEFLSLYVGDFGGCDQHFRRFESLRSYALIPRGQVNASVRLTNFQIASAVLGYGPIPPSYAGHASYIWGNLQPVGGVITSLGGRNLLDVVASLVSNEDRYSVLKSLTLAVERDFSDEKFSANLKINENDTISTVSFVSNNDFNSLRNGADLTYDHDSLGGMIANRRSFSPMFFRELSRKVAVSRALNRPLETDFREYITEEQRSALYKRIGVNSGSSFLNVGVDTQVTWPNEPTLVTFEYKNLILFPKTQDHVHTVSIDLNSQRLSEECARTLINRFLSLLSWCCDSHAIIQPGSIGSPVPQHVPKTNLAFATAPVWAFRRELPADDDLLQRLAYYREGKNAQLAQSYTYEVLSFFKVIEQRSNSRPGTPNPTKKWVRDNFDTATANVTAEILQQFHLHRNSLEVADYIYENCRVAAAHTSEKYASDADSSPELRRLGVAGTILKALARYYIKNDLKFSDSFY